MPLLYLLERRDKDKSDLFYLPCTAFLLFLFVKQRNMFLVLYL
ncbi:hypothetical protein HMPREF0663_11264 [Hoylesella oralis ATCC 33269]|uniref:Uncharacterized protein n=1 Tax=Hoylesella oralis ATCC 33269 TaxID=873533 RepID=E7RQ13_9BACT|nr:hypothetical protein HMPREF0663_11264 [Hoylesella oralis ATCC 33269]